MFYLSYLSDCGPGGLSTVVLCAARAEENNMHRGSCACVLKSKWDIVRVELLLLDTDELWK